MNNKVISLIHVASSHIIGLTNQEVNLALALKQNANLKLTVVSGENEQIQGCFSRLDLADISVKVIKGFDVHRDFIRLLNEFSAICESENADIVSVNTNWQLLIAGLAKIINRNNFKIIYTVHGFRNHRPFISIIARILIGFLLFIFADAIQAPSNYVRNKFFFLWYKIKVLPLGEDDLFFAISSRPNFDLPLQFCFAGQFRKGKNQDVLVKAFSDYVKISDDKTAKLFLCGEGDLLSKSQKIVNKNGMSKQIIFTGQLNREKMVNLYQSCQIAVVPTNSETFGHCIAEPLALGRILLSRPVGIAPDYIKHGVNGFIYKNRNELVMLMLSLRAIDKDGLVRISDLAHETGRVFKWSNVANLMYEIIIKPLAKKAASIK